MEINRSRFCWFALELQKLMKSLCFPISVRLLFYDVGDFAANKTIEKIQ